MLIRWLMLTLLPFLAIEDQTMEDQTGPDSEAGSSSYLCPPRIAAV